MVEVAACETIAAALREVEAHRRPDVVQAAISLLHGHAIPRQDSQSLQNETWKPPGSKHASSRVKVSSSRERERRCLRRGPASRRAGHHLAG